MIKICWKCGNEYKLKEGDKYLEIGQRRWCPECCEGVYQHAQEVKKWQAYIKNYNMIENCIKILEKQNYDLYDYKEAIDAVSDAVHSGKTRMHSSLEMAVVVELISQRVRVKTQVNCLGYNLDIVLPELKIVVEVDGYQHARTKQKDAARDIYVHEKLGKEWEVVRIKENRINRELKGILSWILRERDKQQEYRKKNEGMVPWTYNQNEYTEIYRLGKKLIPLKEKPQITPANPI